MNASVLNGPETFQNNVYSIHALGSLLPLVEWTTIFLPLIFHAVIGVWIIHDRPAEHESAYGVRRQFSLHVLQRASAVSWPWFSFSTTCLHMHGWFHAEWWLRYIAEPLGGAQLPPVQRADHGGRGAAEPADDRCSTPSASSPVCSTWRTGSGRWASPGEHGRVPPAQKKALGGLWGVRGRVFSRLGCRGCSAWWRLRLGRGASSRRGRSEQQMFDAKIEQRNGARPDSHEVGRKPPHRRARRPGS